MSILKNKLKKLMKTETNDDFVILNLNLSLAHSITGERNHNCSNNQCSTASENWSCKNKSCEITRPFDYKNMLCTNTGCY